MPCLASPPKRHRASMWTASLPALSLDCPSRPVSPAPPISTTLKEPSRPSTCVCPPYGIWPVPHRTRPTFSPKRLPTQASTTVRTVHGWLGTSLITPPSTTAIPTTVLATLTTKSCRRTLSVKYLKPSFSPTETLKPAHRPTSPCSTWPTIRKSVVLTTTT